MIEINIQFFINAWKIANYFEHEIRAKSIP